MGTEEQRRREDMKLMEKTRKDDRNHEFCNLKFWVR